MTKVRIIPTDNLVSVGGKALRFDLTSFEINNNYHAIHWDGETGFIETKVGRNIILTSLEEFQPLLNEHATLVAADAALLEAAEEASIPLHKSVYHKQRVSDGITINGISIKANDKTERRLMAARIVAKENAAYTVKWEAENGFFELNAAQIIAVADALLAHIQKCFAAKEAIASEQYLTKEEVEQAFDAAYDSL